MTANGKTRNGRVPWLLEPHPVARGQNLEQRLARARLTLLKRRESRWPWLPLCLLLAVGLAAAGQAPPVSAEQSGTRDAVARVAQTGAGSLFLDGTRAPRLGTDVEIEVSGLVARVAVRQRFENPGTDWVEGVYVFPLPDGAAIDRLRMQIGERVIEGEIREREAAQKTYVQARNAGNGAGIVEQERPNLFTTSVANIAPGETVAIEIGYLETLAYHGGRFSVRFPMTLTPRYVPGETGPDTSPRLAAISSHDADAARISPPFASRASSPSGNTVTLVVDIDAGFPLDGIESLYHPVRIDDRGDRYIVTLAAAIPADRDFELRWRPLVGNEPRSTVFTETVDGQRYALLLLLPPQMDAVPAPQAREMIFVIDTSGSMHGDSLAQAKAAVAMALARLRPADRFNIVQFNASAESLYPESVPVSAGRRADALRYVRALQADGGTEMRPALSLALQGVAPAGQLRQIVFITDGSVGNEEELLALIHARLGAARLFTVGIGPAPNGWFMRKAAQFGRGTFTLIGSKADVGDRMQSLFVKLESPVLTDLAIEWPGETAPEMWPARPRDLYAGEPMVVVARLSRGHGMIALSGRTAGGHWLRQHDPKLAGEHSGIAALWARARIESLMDQLVAGGDPDAVRAQVVETALRHGLVSRYTSLVAVDRTPARPAGADPTRKPVPSLLPAATEPAMHAGFPQTATPAALRFLAGGMLLVGALLSACLRRHRLARPGPAWRRRFPAAAIAAARGRASSPE